MVPSSTTSLSPIPDDSATRLLVDSLVAFRHYDGRYELRRDLTHDERQALKARSSAITSHMKAARSDYIVECVMMLMMGWGSGRSEADAQAVASQYASVLYGLPGWAIKRACNLWAIGHVTPDQIGAKSIDRSFPPSAAQVRLVAEDVVRPYMQEYARLMRTLAAMVVPRELTREERDASAARLEAIRDDLEQRNAAANLEADAADIDADFRRQQATRKAGQRTDALILAEYKARGLTPPEGQLLSLSSLLSLGWTIEDGRLLRPKEKPRAATKKGRRAAGDESRVVGG